MEVAEPEAAGLALAAAEPEAAGLALAERAGLALAAAEAAGLALAAAGELGAAGEEAGAAAPPQPARTTALARASARERTVMMGPDSTAPGQSAEAGITSSRTGASNGAACWAADRRSSSSRRA